MVEILVLGVQQRLRVEGLAVILVDLPTCSTEDSGGLTPFSQRLKRRSVSA